MNPNKMDVRMVDLSRTGFTKEARHIQERAARGETVVVRVGQLIFFCANEDDWMLDPEDWQAWGRT